MVTWFGTWKDTSAEDRHAQLQQALPREPPQGLEAFVPSYQAMAATIAYPTGVNGAALVAVSSEAQLTCASTLERQGNRV